MAVAALLAVQEDEELVISVTYPEATKEGPSLGVAAALWCVCGAVAAA